MELVIPQFTPAAAKKQEVRRHRQSRGNVSANSLEPMPALVSRVVYAQTPEDWAKVAEQLIARNFKVPAKEVLYPTFRGADETTQEKLITKLSNKYYRIARNGGIDECTEGFRTVLQAASNINPGEFLWQANRIRALYKSPKMNRPLPLKIKERIDACLRFHRESMHFRGEHFVRAGYEPRESGANVVWVHMVTRDSITVYGSIVRSEKSSVARKNEKSARDAAIRSAMKGGSGKNESSNKKNGGKKRK